MVLSDGLNRRSASWRGTFTSVKELIAAIETFIEGWNERSQPFTGPRPPTRSSRKQPVVKEHHSRDARSPACPSPHPHELARECA